MQPTKSTAPIPDWRYPREPSMRGQVERDLEIQQGIWSYSTYLVDTQDEHKRYFLNSMRLGTRLFTVEAALLY